MEIKVLGSGCANCKKLHDNVQAACQELALKADIIYVTDFLEIAKTGLMRTPGLMIDGKIVSAGRVLQVDEAKHLIQANTQE
ncbi:MAG: thioredoxin family protein [Candidatus Izemoplasmatales bacterium]|nr:thioredoxin family protein [Candidatus Izemoplasmatales bacterium]